MNAKSALKAAKTAIQEKNYSTAIYNAELAIRHDPDNYHARVFMGLAYFNQEKFVESEKWYTEAVDKNPSEMLAYQGLLNLYTSRNHVEGLLNTWDKLRLFYRSENDLGKYLEYTNSIIEKSMQTKDEAKALVLLKELWQEADTLGDMLNKVDTLERIISLEEAKISSLVSAEVHKRRFRLGASPLSQLQVEVESEVISAAGPLEYFYDQLLSICSPDLKQQVSLKYFSYLQKKLLVVDINAGKAQLREVMDGLAKNIQLPDSTLLQYRLESVDISEIKQLDDIIKALSVNLEGDKYMEMISLLRKRSTASHDEVVTFAQDILKTSHSRIAHLLNCEASSQTDDYHGTANACRDAIKTLKARQQNECLPVKRTLSALSLLLANALRHLEIEEVANAETIYEEYLRHNEPKLDAVVNLCDVYQKRHKMFDAVNLLKKYQDQFTDEFEFKCAFGWAYFNTFEFQQAEKYLKECLNVSGYDKEKAALSLSLKLGKVYWQMGDIYQKDKQYAFSYFLRAAKDNPESDEPFEYLGKYYMMTKDEERSLRCFRKAFENNSSNISVAKELFQLLVKAKNLEEASQVAHTMADAPETNQTSSWAAKFLGSHYRDKQDFSNSIFYIQLSLKANQNDLDCWMILGDSYEKQGRYVSSIKAFSRAKSFLGDFDLRTGYILFRLGVLRTAIGLYEFALIDLNRALSIMNSGNAESLPIVCALLETFLVFSREKFHHGYFGESYTLANQGIDVVLMFMPKLEAHRGNNQAMLIILKGTFDLVSQLLELPAKVNSFHQSKVESLWEFFAASSSKQSMSLFELAVQIMREAIKRNSKDGSYWYSLAQLYYKFASQNKEFSKFAFNYCAEAVKVDPSSSVYWNGLGVFSMFRNKELSQHAFIKAIELNTCNTAVPWTNLGILYLLNHDSLLAQDCFIQAQTADPEWYQAWFATSIINQHDEELSFKNLKHAVSLYQLNSEVNNTVATLLVNRISQQKEIPAEFLYEARFLLSKSLELGSLGCVGLNNFGLILEHMGFTEYAVELYQKALARSEKNESQQCAILANLSRCYLRNKSYDLCLETDVKIIQSQVSTCTLLVRALSLYFANRLQESISLFEQIITDDTMKPSSARFVRLCLARLLTALGTNESIELAKNQLLTVFQNERTFMPALSTLLALGIKYHSAETCQLVIAEAENILEDDIQKEDMKDFRRLKSYFFHWQNHPNKAKTEIFKLVRKYPLDPDVWAKLVVSLAEFFPNYREDILSVNAVIPAVMQAHVEIGSSTDSELKYLSLATMDLTIAQLTLHQNPSNIWNWINMYVCKKLNGLGSLADLEWFLKCAISLKQISNVEQQFVMDIFAAEIALDISNEQKQFDIIPYIKAVDNAIQNCTSWTTKRAGYIVLAKCMEKINPEEALKYLVHAQSLFPKSWFVVKELALFMFKYGQVDQGKPVIKDFVDQSSPSIAISANLLLSWLLSESGDTEGAGEAINNALKVDSKNETARILQSMILLKQGNKSKAQKILSNINHPLKDKLLQ